MFNFVKRIELKQILTKAVNNNFITHVKYIKVGIKVNKKEISLHT